MGKWQLFKRSRVVDIRLSEVADLGEANVIIKHLREELAAICVALGRSKDGTGYDVDWFDLHGDVARLALSETPRVGTIGHVHPEIEIGRALATALSTDKQDEGRCDICKAEIDEFNAGVEAWRAGVAFHDLPDMPMDQNGVGWVWAAWNGKTFAPSHVAALTPDWCMDAFWRANPGRNAVVPSLYLLDFAREVLRVHGVQSATAQRNGIIEECAKQCDASADEAEELLRRQPWSEYARACMNEAASLAIRIRALAAAESRSKDV
jgi:hypothetical protein